MKQSLSFFLFTLCASISFAQEVTVENIEDHFLIASDSNMVIVSGDNFRKDGLGPTALLYNYDKDLELKWTYEIDSCHTNIIDASCIHQNLIYISGITGKRDKNTLKTNRFVIVLDSLGNKIHFQNLGSSTHIVTNMFINDNKIMLAYNKSSSPYYGAMMTKSTTQIVTYSVANKKFSTLSYQLPRSFPEIITKHNNNTLLLGYAYDEDIQNKTNYFYIAGNAETNNNLISPVEKNYTVLLGVLSTQNGYSMISSNSPRGSDTLDFIRIDQLNKSGEFISSKKILFSEYNWTKISYYTQIKKDELWIFSFEKNLQTNLTRLDKEGKIINQIKVPFDKYDSLKRYLVNKNDIYYLKKNNYNKLKLGTIKID